MPDEPIPSYEDFTKQFYKRVRISDIDLNQFLTMFNASVQTSRTLRPLTCDDLVMNWGRLLFQLHCGQQGVLEHFLEYEQDIVDAIGYQSYVHYREQCIALMHAKNLSSKPFNQLMAWERLLLPMV